MGRRVIIVGGGASGLMAGITAAGKGADVTILEGNEKPGRKLLASGNGKCNLTNLTQNPSCYRGHDPSFLWNVIQRFPAEQVLAFFTGLGLVTIQREGWIYPRTEQSESVLQVLLMEAAYRKVRIKTREHVTSVRYEDGCFRVRTDTWTYPADAVIIACGSSASAVRGSSDTALQLAEQLKQRTAPFLPALVPLRIRGDLCKRWEGVRIHAAVTLFSDGQPMMREEGNVQLTGYGISGIPVFQISSPAVKALNSGKKDIRVIIDFCPEHDRESLEALLVRQAKFCPYKTIRQLLTGLLPEQLIPLLAEKNSTVSEVCGRIKAFPVEITGAASPKHAQVSSGGILTEGLDETLQSKTVPGLYFCGAAVDADGICGGYNLQWAWSSGYVAGGAAAGESPI